MTFKPGNRWWEARTTVGRHKFFEDANQLWVACVEYFQWVEENPLYEVKGFAYEGAVTKEEFPKMRAATLNGLCLFLDINETTWRGWKARADLLPVIERAEKAIREQKFGGAAAGLLNANIIARDLGLVEKKELSGDPDRPVVTENVTTVKLDPVTVRDALKSVQDDC